MSGSSSDAYALNAFGAVAGTALDGRNELHGFAYEGLMQSFEADSDARGINSAGTVVGTSQGYATVWRNGTAESLGTLGGAIATGSQSTILAMSPELLYAPMGEARIPCLERTTDRLGYARRLMERRVRNQQRRTDCGRLGNRGRRLPRVYLERGQRYAGSGNLGGNESRAFAVNSAGAVAGASTTRTGQYRAVLWAGEGSPTDLGTLGGLCSFAYGVNDAGYVVGYSYDAQGRSRAFVWADGMLFDLNDLVQNAPGWSLTAAYGINASGQIVGTGAFNGRNSAFLLDPQWFRVSNESGNLAVVSDVPEPSTGYLLAGAVLALALRRKLNLSSAP